MALDSIPFLGGYQTMDAINRAKEAQQIQQAGQFMTLQNVLQSAPLKNALLQSQVAEHQAKAAKLKQEATFNERISQMGGSESLTPDQLDALGTRANIAGLSSGLGLLKLAEQKRAKAQETAVLDGMKSKLVADVPSESESQAIERVQAATEAGQPASVGFGESPNVIPRKDGGVASYLTDSPYVGNAAKALQQRIDSGQIKDPKVIDGWLKNLNDRHVSQTGLQAARDQRPQVVGGGDASGDLTPEAIKDLAIQSLYDPKVLVGLGRDTRTRKLIQNEATRQATAAGANSNDIASGRAGFKADSASLSKLTQSYDAVTAFEKTAIRNGDRLLQLADKVDVTGVPVLEKWIRAGRQATGDPDVAMLNAQMQVYRTEAARILTNPNLTGQLTDSARHEVEGFLSGGASAKQIRDVVGLLKSDFENRKITLEDQIRAIRNRMRGRQIGADSENPEASPKTATEPKTQSKVVDFSSLK
jgi:hypothetical protein